MVKKKSKAPKECANIDVSSDKEFDALFATIQKSAAKDCPALLSTEEAKTWQYTTFDDSRGGPCLPLEWLFGCKGLIGGRVLKLDAMEGTGKSSILLALMGMSQRNDGAICQQYETEDAPMPPDRIAALRCNPKRLMIRQPNGIDACLTDAENCVKVVREQVSKDHPIIIGIDSISNLGETACDLATGESEDGKGVASHSRKFSSFFRNKLSFFRANNTVLIATAQIKTNIATGPGAQSAKKTTTIAEGTFKYMSSWVMKMKEFSAKDYPGDEHAVDVRVTCTKNKLAPKDREIYITLFRDGRGWDFSRAYKELLFGRDCPLPGELKSAGGWYSHPEINEGKNTRWDTFYKEFISRDDLIMRCREALQIRGFGFDFEQKFLLDDEDL